MYCVKFCEVAQGAIIVGEHYQLSFTAGGGQYMSSVAEGEEYDKYSTFNFCKSMSCVRFHVYFSWKLKVVIKLDGTFSTTNKTTGMYQHGVMSQ